MFIHDDKDSARIGDRIIAAVVGALCGLALGWVIQRVVGLVVTEPPPITWITAAGFAIYGGLAPARSTALWSGILEGILGFFGSIHR